MDTLLLADNEWQKFRRMCIRYAAMIAVFVGGMLLLAFLFRHSALLPNIIKYIFLVEKSDQLQVEVRNTVLPGFFVLITAAVSVISVKLRHRGVVILALWIVTVAQLGYDIRKYMPVAEAENIYPENPLTHELQQFSGFDRFITIGQTHIDANIPLYFGLHSPEGVASMYPQRYGELVSYAVNQRVDPQPVSRIDAYINPTADKILAGKNPVLQRFLRIAGVKYLVESTRDTNNFPSSIPVQNPYQVIWKNSDWRIWADTEVLPRAFVTGDYRVVSNDRTILSEMFDPTHSPRQIVLEKSPGIPINQQASGNASIIRFTPNSVVIRSESNQPALVFLSDTFSPTFMATVDGKAVPLLRADYAFRAVAVRAGIHTVVMSYSLGLWKAGAVVSLVLWLIGGGACIYFIRRKMAIF
jgi:hypothetical protein